MWAVEGDILFIGSISLHMARCGRINFTARLPPIRQYVLSKGKSFE